MAISINQQSRIQRFGFLDRRQQPKKLCVVSTAPGETRHFRLTQLVAQEQNSTLGELDIGKVILDVGRTAADTGLAVPSELTLLGKTLLQLDEVGAGRHRA